MNLLLVDQSAVGLSLALRARDAGHQVKWFTRTSTTGRGFKGLERIDNWVSSASWADLIVSTSDQYIPKLDMFRMKVPIIAPNARALEHCEPQNIEHEGAAVRITRFFGQTGWVGPQHISFEYKKLTVVCLSDDLPVLDHPFVRGFTDSGYRGPVTVDAVIDDSGACCLKKISVGMQWPLSNFLLGAVKKDPVRWMLDAFHGKDTTSFTDDVGVYIVLDPGLGTKIEGITRGTQKHVHPVHVQMEDGWIATDRNSIMVTGFGKGISQASKRAYGTAKKLRMDLEGSTEVLDTLHAKGLALGCTVHNRVERSTAAARGPLPTGQPTLPSSAVSKEMV